MNNLLSWNICKIYSIWFCLLFLFSYKLNFNQLNWKHFKITDTRSRTRKVFNLFKQLMDFLRRHSVLDSRKKQRADQLYHFRWLTMKKRFYIFVVLKTVCEETKKLTSVESGHPHQKLCCVTAFVHVAIQKKIYRL